MGGKAAKDVEKARDQGISAYREYERTGRLERLDAAVDLLRRAVEAAPSDHPSRPARLSDLGAILRARFERTGQPSDLEAAIDLFRQAATSNDHPNRARYLANLGAALQTRSGRTGQSADLDAAIDSGRQAVAATTADYADRPLMLSNLGAALHTRFERTGQPADLDAALDLYRQAVAAAPNHHPSRALYMSNLGVTLKARFGRTGQLPDLDAAIDHYQQAVTALPDVHPHRARYLSNLGVALQTRFRSTGRKTDRDAAIGCQREAAGIVTALPRDRLRAAESWGRGAFNAGDSGAGADGYAAAVELLPQVAWHGQDQRTREEHLAGWTSLAADAAACAVIAGQHRRAVELLEAGRSLIWTQQLHLRSDLSRLTERAPSLAAELEHARTDLDLPLPLLAPGAMNGDLTALDDLTSTGTIQREALERRHQAARRWDEALAQVHRLEGFEHFLKPIPVTELRAAAAGGPVVIVNASQLGCHVLIFTANGDPGVEVIPLPGLTRSDAVDQANLLLRVISRAGDLSRPDRDKEADRRAVFDILDWLWRVVAEPVLNALGHTGPAAVGTKWPRIWWCPTGPLTMLPLHAAGHYPVAGTVPGSSAQTVPARVISSYTPTLAALQRAREASVVAPHTIRQLAIGMDHAELAFLSACQTATGDLRLPDEAIHLAAAMQLLGYRHVIATMWTIADKPAPGIADVIYSHLTTTGHPDSTDAAHALHQAVSMLRAHHPDQPLLWGPYIHIGP